MYQSIEALQSTIADLCTEKGITINKLAFLSGLTQSTIDSIMKGKSRNPKIETLRKISIGFNMEYDEFIAYLRSAEEENNPTELSNDKFTHETGIFMAKRLRKLRKQKGVTLIEVKKSTGVRIDYESHMRYEDFSHLIALANYFDVSLDYLCGRSENPKRR